MGRGSRCIASRASVRPGLGLGLGDSGGRLTLSASLFSFPTCNLLLSNQLERKKRDLKKIPRLETPMRLEPLLVSSP